MIKFMLSGMIFPYCHRTISLLSSFIFIESFIYQILMGCRLTRNLESDLEIVSVIVNLFLFVQNVGTTMPFDDYVAIHNLHF